MNYNYDFFTRALFRLFGTQDSPIAWLDASDDSEWDIAR